MKANPALFLTLALAMPAFAQITPSKESLSDLYPGKSYSPYAERALPDPAAVGGHHLHTALSVDAGLFGCLASVAELETVRAELS